MARWLGEQTPFVQLTAKRARLALATTPETEERLKRLGCQHVKVLSQVAMPNDEIMRLKSIPLRTANPFRLMSIGRLLHWKGFHLGLMAFARLQEISSASEYWLIGDGPERRNLECLARRLGVADKVRFLGNLPRQRVLEELAECDVLVHPSLHGSSGSICLEAMAAGRPIICLDLGGPALQVTEETGFKISASSPQQAVNDLAEAMRRLAQDPILRADMAEAARKRVAEYFAWHVKGELMKKVCQEIVDRRYAP
jgi:glycosyltransferase involved in cell wall biosynthesis